jgi:hypothetical protein
MTFSKRFLGGLFVGAFATIIHSTGQAQSLPTKEYDLTEFRLTVEIPEQDPIRVNCGKDQIEQGLFDLMWVGEGKKPGRTLVASEQPMRREASWLFNNDKEGCPSLAPYFNGIGIDEIDINSGKARFYLANIYISDSTRILERSKSEFNLMREYYMAEFETKNRIYFEGQCELKTPHRWAIWQSQKLVCHLGGENVVVLTRR